MNLGANRQALVHGLVSQWLREYVGEERMGKFYEEAEQVVSMYDSRTVNAVCCIAIEAMSVPPEKRKRGDLMDLLRHVEGTLKEARKEDGGLE